MKLTKIFQKREFIDYKTYKAHIDFLDDIYYTQKLMKKKMAET